MKEKYNWNLQDIFENEEQFKKEKGEIADILEKIKTYQGILCNTSENLYNCYKLYEQALEKFEKVYAYGMLKYHLDMSNQEGIKIFKEVEGLGTEFSVATSFMTPEITYADENTIKEYIKEERLKGYERDIKDILNEKKHVLSKEEENILANFTEMYISNLKAKATTAKLRKYNSSLEEAVEHDDASLKVYESLIEAVNEDMNVNYEFIKLKKKMLNLDEMHMYDLYVNPCEQGKDEITFEDAKQEVLNALQILGKEYINKLEEAFDNRWIDVYAKPNKRGGAYSMGVYGVHPFVLTNFVNSKRDISTIAHELGHSMHSYYSNREQNVINADYTIMVAEVASTVNEILLSDYQIKNEKDNKKKAELLYELLEMIRATLFRQAMFAEFEKDVHDKIENNVMLSADDLNDMYYKLNQKYFGPDVNIDEQIKYEWARIPHFYSDFYVYKYCTGVSSAIAIASKILSKEPGFVEKYIEMLKQGCSKKSIDLLKMVDVDLESKDTYKSAIEFYNQKIKELKMLL